MKLVHKNPDIQKNHITAAEWLLRAKEFEEDGETEKAMEACDNAIKKNPLHENAYNRLMILLRKKKEYKKELIIIEKAIDKFTQFYKPPDRPSHSGKIKKLSLAISKATGLSDKKNQPLFQPGPIGRWKRRKKTVEKIIVRQAK